MNRDLRDWEDVGVGGWSGVIPFPGVSTRYHAGRFQSSAVRHDKGENKGEGQVGHNENGSLPNTKLSIQSVWSVG